MPIELARWIAWICYAYIGVGLALLPWWHWCGLERLDLAAARGPRGFRVIISPGLVALWPPMLVKAARGNGHPPVERNVHRDRARARDVS
jgi:hypothetical protein